MTNLRPDIIGITTYNRGAILRDCVRSVRETAPGIPVWIFDDCSHDPEHLAVLRELKTLESVNVVRFPENQGSNYSNQRFLKFFFDLRTPRWVILDDDLIFEGPWLETLSLAWGKNFDHHFFDNPDYDNHPRGTRPRGVFLAGTYRLLQIVGGFNLPAFNVSGYGGCHPDWTKRAQRAGLAPQWGLDMPYRLAGVRSASGARKTKWAEAGIEYGTLGRGKIFQPIAFDDSRASWSTPVSNWLENHRPKKTALILGRGPFDRAAAKAIRKEGAFTIAVNSIYPEIGADVYMAHDSDNFTDPESATFLPKLPDDMTAILSDPINKRNGPPAYPLCIPEGTVCNVVTYSKANRNYKPDDLYHHSGTVHSALHLAVRLGAQKIILAGFTFAGNYELQKIGLRGVPGLEFVTVEYLGVAGERQEPTQERTAPNRELEKKEKAIIAYGMKGIGDLIVYAAARPQDRELVVYNDHGDFAELFEGVRCLPRPGEPGNLAPGTIRLDKIFAEEMGERGAGPQRHLRYAAALKNPAPALPKIREGALEQIPVSLAHSTYVILAPWSAWPERAWPLDQWIRLNHWVQKYGWQVVILDAPKQERRNRPLMIGNTKVFAGAKPGLVASLIGRAAVLVGNDSGPAHLAGVLGTRALVLAGYTANGAGGGIYSFYNRAHGREVVSEIPAPGCGGCWRDPDKNWIDQACNVGCNALARLQWKTVLDRAIALIAECQETRRRAM